MRNSFTKLSRLTRLIQTGYNITLHFVLKVLTLLLCYFKALLVGQLPNWTRSLQTPRNSPEGTVFAVQTDAYELKGLERW